jgi:hypothetical protein
MVKPIISGPYKTFRRLNTEETFLEFEESTITIPMKGRRSPNEPWMEEEIKLKAFMRLEIYPLYVNNLGTREFQFIIRDWDLYGKSTMLNRLFFDNPLGYFDPETKCHIPAVVTFTVSNNYSVEGDDNREIFAHEKHLEIRDLTSHNLRFYTEFRERGDNSTYTLPGNRIYWQIVAPDSLKDKKLNPNTDGTPLIIFHCKPPVDSNSQISNFDVNNPQEADQYLLGISDFTELTSRSIEEFGVQFQTKIQQQDNDCEHARTQLRANTVLSPLYKARSPIDIRWKLSDQIRDVGQLKEFIGRQGYIRIVSPAKSLGTADQSPDIGHPIDSADFPARMTYAINYHIHVNRERFVEDQSGIAIAVGVLEVPPRDVTVAFDKPHIGHVLERFLEFGPGHCTGMHEIPEEEYLSGMNFSRYWRTVPLDPTNWIDYQPYDPNRKY